MPIDLEVLKSSGLTNDRLEEIFTAEPDADQAAKPEESKFVKEGETFASPGSDILSLPDNPTNYQIRQFIETRIERRLREAWDRTFESFRLYAAVDIAMDATPINRYNWPLMMLAQGNIDLEQCCDQVSQLSEELAGRLFQKKPDGKPFKVNLPKFTEISYNLVHSLVTRRVAAVSTPISTRFPFLKFDARSTSMVAKLRADLMTQKAEIMSDQFGYRHDVVQSVRDASCYGHQIEFARSSWDKETQKLRVPKAKDGTTGVGDNKTDYEEKEVIVREGVDFIAPHPSRSFWDIAYPVAKLNSDSGPSYAGYWDVMRFGDIRMNTSYYNREKVEMDPAAWEFLTSNQAYFRIYYPDTIVFPTKDRLGNASSMSNDRKSNVGYYAAGDDDVSVTITQYFEKIKPSDFGIADYDGYVWIRFVIGGNRTVIFAEIMPSAPACVYHYNENDSRLYSPSFAHTVMPYQDQVSNLLSQLLEIQLQGLTKIFELNKDGMEAADISAFEDSVKQRQYDSAKAIVLKYSAQTLRDMGIDQERVARLRAVEITTSEKTNEIFRSIVQLLSFAERLLFFSPQELGQVAPREITATEANIVNNTTLGIRDFHTIGIEEGLAAKKRIIAESTMVFGSDEITLPVIDRYPKSVIEKLGAKIVETDGDPDTTELAKSGRFTLQIGRQELVADYAFTSRDGLDRPQSSEIAKTQVQLLQIVGSSPQLQQVFGTEKAVTLINEIARNLGVDLKLEVPAGMSPDSALQPDVITQVKQLLGQVTQAVSQVADAQQQDRAQLSKVTQAIANIAKALSAQAASTAQTLPTRKGTVSPTIPHGAPPLNGLAQPMEPPQFFPDDEPAIPNA